MIEVRPKITIQHDRRMRRAIDCSPWCDSSGAALQRLANLCISIAYWKLPNGFRSAPGSQTRRIALLQTTRNMTEFHDSLPPFLLSSGRQLPMRSDGSVCVLFVTTFLLSIESSFCR